MKPEPQINSGRPLREIAFDLHTDPFRSLAMLPEGAKAFLRLAQITFEELLHWCTTPIEVLLRHRFGRRWASVVLLLQLSLVGYLLSTLGRLIGDTVLVLAAILPALAAAYHWWEAWRWERRGTHWRHTYSRGQPLPWLWGGITAVLKWLGLRPHRWLTTAFINRLGQPLLCFVLGLLLLPLSGLLGLYLLAAAVALVVKAQVVHWMIKQLEWDTKDAQSMGQWMAGITSTGAGGDTPPQFHVQVVTPLPARLAVEPVSARTVASSNPSLHTLRAVMSCPQCGTRLRMPQTTRARKGTCPSCGKGFIIPATVAGHSNGTVSK